MRPLAQRGETRPLQVVGDETDAVAVEQRQYVLVVPALVAELDDLLEVAWAAAEEALQPFEVLMQARRQLVEQGAELVPERPGKLDEAVHLLSQSSSFFMWVMKRLTLTA